MNAEKIREIMRVKGAEAATSARIKMCNEVESLKAKVEAACSAYFSDVEQRKERLEARIAALQEQAGALAADAEQVKPALVRASVEGDDRGVMKIQEELANIEAKRAAVVDQIEMLENAAVPGNDDLYKAALTKNDELEEAISKLEDVERAMRKYAAEQISAWTKIRELLKSPISVIPYEGFDTWGRHARDQIDKLQEHYERGMGEQQ